jgi:hypothetical protein
MKFYEVGPNLNITQHAIDPADLLLRQDVRSCRRTSGRDPQGRQKPARSAGSSSRARMPPSDAFERPASSRRSRSHRAQMKKLADPVMAEYAKEIGAEAIYNKINSM